MFRFVFFFYSELRYDQIQILLIQMQSSLQVQSLLNWKESVWNLPAKPNETNHRTGIIKKKNLTEPSFSSVEMILIRGLCSLCFIAFLSRDKLWFWLYRLPRAFMHLSKLYNLSWIYSSLYRTASTDLDQTLLFECLSEALTFAIFCHFCQSWKWISTAGMNLETWEISLC